jgi:hypothetical protein
MAKPNFINTRADANIAERSHAPACCGLIPCRRATSNMTTPSTKLSRDDLELANSGAVPRR